MTNTPTTQIEFATNSYKSRSGIMSSERVVNFYAEPSPSSSPFRGIMIGTPGLIEWVNLSQFEPIFGSIDLGNKLYVVCGLNFYEIEPESVLN